MYNIARARADFGGGGGGGGVFLWQSRERVPR